MVRVRFAPSPTGDLHVGNGRTAVLNYLYARSRGGAFILRIEDTDVKRSEARFEISIGEDLEWLGLPWDEGPFRQSDRLGVYRERLDGLLSKGAAYRCFCSEEELERHREACRRRGLPPRYSGACRDLSPSDAARYAREGRASVVRFRSREGGDILFRDGIHGDVRFPADHVDDFILMRQDGIPSYNFAVVVDDLDMGITQVIRGADHLSNTPKQLMLFSAFGANPPEYAHHGLLMGNDRKPLSKRHGATRVAEFRQMGILPEALVNYLAILGRKTEREVQAPADLAEHFSLSSLSASDAIFDFEKLLWLNKEHLMAVPPEELLARLGLDACLRERAVVLRENARTLTELRELFGIFDDPAVTREALSKLDAADEVGRIFPALERLFRGDGELQEALTIIERDLALPRRQAMMLLRIVVTGRQSGPPLSEVFRLMPKDTILKRISWLHARSSISSEA